MRRVGRLPAGVELSVLERFVAVEVDVDSLRSGVSSDTFRSRRDDSVVCVHGRA